MPIKIAISFVVYAPSMEQLNRIHEASRSGFSVYVYDNSPEKINCKVFARNRGKAVYLTCGKNAGLGLGMASVCAQAYYDGHSALLFFDQDTVFNGDTLSFIDEFYVKNAELEKTYSSVTFNAKKIKSPNEVNNKQVYDVLLVINSGSLFFLENVKNLNWHNEKYFVDCVDYEFCLNSKIKGFKIGEFSFTPGFDHSSEQEDKGYHIFGRNYSMRAYAFSRIYDTCSASFKLLLKSLFAGQIKFFWVIFKLLAIYIATQLFVRIFGWMFKKRMQGG